MIGVLQMSYDSTEFYISELKRNNQNFQLTPTPFNQINEFLPKPNPELKKILIPYLKKMSSSNFESILIPNISIHETIEEIFNESKIELPIINPIYVTIKQLKSKAIESVYLFGSYYTMQENYVSKSFEKQGIRVLFPESNDSNLIDEIRKTVYRKKYNNNTLKSFDQVLSKYSKNHTVVLACTELSMIYNGNNSTVLDMVKIQICESL